jgi:hypothetical protein
VVEVWDGIRVSFVVWEQAMDLVSSIRVGTDGLYGVI